MRTHSVLAALAALATGIHGAAQTPLRLELVAGGFDRPLFVTAPTGDVQRLFVAEKGGRIEIVRNGVLLPQPFLDVAATTPLLDAGEGGLLCLAFHPQYATNGQFFVCYSTYNYPEMAVRRYVRSASNPDLADPSSGVEVLAVTMEFGNHNGGMIAFGPDGMLYVGTGDGGAGPPLFLTDPQNHGQRGDTLLSKILRIDVDHPASPLAYGIPAGNPYAGPGDPRDEIWARGLRNPWRFSFDRLTGDLWIADVGGSQEEIDFEPAGSPGGRNYGWACTSGTDCTGIPVCTCGSAALTMPIHQYTLGGNMAVIGGYVYRGAAIPDLQGTYFFADFARNRIWSLRQQAGVATDLRERTAELTAPPGATLAGISSFGEDAVGELYVCSMGGDVFRIAPVTGTVAGVLPFGQGSPGCNGPHALAASSSPTMGNGGFALLCSNGLPSSYGLTALASLTDVSGTDAFGLGMLLHFRLDSAFLDLHLVPTDAAGTSSFGLPVPNDPFLVGQSVCAQAGFVWNPACPARPGGWSSSNGLWITIQP